MNRRFLILFFALAISVTYLAHESYFGTSTYAEGDHAANALQIANAKALGELHGNYSRWSFHHPGPAFFYIAALGEWLLSDVAHLTPTPHGAHLYASALLQLAFYAAALALIARQSRHPWPFIALALVAGALHFPHVDRVFYGLWPPDVLLLPMLCFVTACAALSAGDAVAFPVMILAGGFLVHGHVAQPLFVVPLSTMALAVGWRTAWRDHLSTLLRSRAGIAAIALLALFILPLALDLRAGSQSNAHDILTHLRFQRTSGQTLWQATLCYGSYFIGLNDPSDFNHLSPEVYRSFSARAQWLVLWFVLLLITIVFCSRRPRDDHVSSTRFARRLLAFWLGASALTLVWGMRQDGGFTFFNSEFNHVLVHMVALMAVFVMVEWFPPLHRAVQTLAVAAAVAGFTLANPFQLEAGGRGEDVNARVAALLQADPKPNAPKLLVFKGEEWASAVTLASALQQRRIPFYVPPHSQIMFGRERVFANQGNVLSGPGISVWHISPRQKERPQGHVIDYATVLTFESAPAITLPIAIDLSRSDRSPVVLNGIDGSEGEYAWTSGPVAVLWASTPPTNGDVELKIEASGALTNANPGGQHVCVTVNGATIGTPVFPGTTVIVRLVIPKVVWNARTPRVIAMNFPDAVCPAERGESADRRQLALRMHRVTLSPLAP